MKNLLNEWRAEPLGKKWIIYIFAFGVLVGATFLCKKILVDKITPKEITKATLSAQPINDWVTLGHDERRTFTSSGDIPGALTLAWIYNTPTSNIQTEAYTSNLISTANAIYLHYADNGLANGRVDKVNTSGSHIWSGYIGVNNDERMHMTLGNINVYPAGTYLGILINEDGEDILDESTGQRRYHGWNDTWGNTLINPSDATTFYTSNILQVDGEGVFTRRINPLFSIQTPEHNVWTQLFYQGSTGAAQDLNGSSLGFENGILYTACRYHFTDGVQHISSGVYAFNATSGAQIFSQSSLPTSPLSIGTYIFLTEDNNLVARNKTNGALVWSQPLTGSVFTFGTTFGSDPTVYFGLYCLQSPVVCGANVIIGTRAGIFAFDQNTGAAVWSNTSVIAMERSIKGTQQYQQQFTYMAAASVSNTLVVCGSDNQIHILSLVDGSEIWAGKPAEPTWYLSNPVIVGNMVYVADGGGHFMALQSGGVTPPIPLPCDTCNITITPPPIPPPVDTVINSFSGTGKFLRWQVTPPGVVEVQRSQKSNSGFATIATVSLAIYQINTKPLKWYRIKYGTRTSNAVQL